MPHLRLSLCLCVYVCVRVCASLCVCIGVALSVALIGKSYTVITFGAPGRVGESVTATELKSGKSQVI